MKNDQKEFCDRLKTIEETIQQNYSQKRNESEETSTDDDLGPLVHMGLFQRIMLLKDDPELLEWCHANGLKLDGVLSAVNYLSVRSECFLT